MAEPKLYINPYKEKEVENFKTEYKKKTFSTDIEREDFVSQQVRDVIERIIKRALMRKFPVKGLDGKEIMVVTWDDLFEGLI